LGHGQDETLGFGKLIRIDRLVNQCNGMSWKGRSAEKK
jgi:hypothetical protein